MTDLRTDHPPTALKKAPQPGASLPDGARPDGIPPPAARPADWPRPPLAVPAAWTDRPPNGARITVAGLVILRQRPGTAKGVVFLTLEDETGVVNIITWRKVFEAYRRAAISGRMLRVTGRIQRADGVTHVIAEEIEDISAMLDSLPR
ncbi:OB-fold nucleic acid binding domain-containing protein [Pseudooceanicola sp. HF7]|uniref:OB-fold nucleic acid binding domain-containing protein n=1 Tax=Pseudooceanicola sp. HF7 TaxID=2721560 RepID=UPI00142FC3CC|nr:OB-fold nucleic acid binding domain-containing protein [Pseudooceanicola sp. HF7]NIZ11681.1 hypothetical protein [Pseudooceanicola sp. HF7]